MPPEGVWSGPHRFDPQRLAALAALPVTGPVGAIGGYLAGKAGEQAGERLDPQLASLPVTGPAGAAGYLAGRAGEKAGEAALEKARIVYEAGKGKAKEKVRAAGEEFGKGAADGAAGSDPGKKASMWGKVVLGLLAVGVVGGVIYAVTQAKSGGKSDE